MIVAIFAAAMLAVGSATEAEPKAQPAQAEEEPGIKMADVLPALPEPEPGIPELSHPAPDGSESTSTQFPATMVAGVPQIIEDLSYDDVMKVAGESVELPRAPTLRLVGGIGIAGVLFAGALMAAAKGLDLVFGPLFEIFK